MYSITQNDECGLPTAWCIFSTEVQTSCCIWDSAARWGVFSSTW